MQYMIVYKGRLLKNLHLLIQNHTRHCFQAFALLLLKLLWSVCCSILSLEAEQTPFSQTGCWFKSADLHRILFRACGFVPVIFLLRDQWMIERLSEALGAALQQFLANSIKMFISHEKKSDLSLPYIKLSYFLTQELCQYSKSGGMFSSSKPVMASSHCSLLGMASRDCSLLGNWSQKHSLFLCLPVQPSQAVPEHCLKSLALDFAVKTFDFLLEKPSEVIARWLAGAQTWTQLEIWTLAPDQGIVEVFSKSAQKPQNDLCQVWILSDPLKTQKYQPLSTKLLLVIWQSFLKAVSKLKNNQRFWLQINCRALGAPDYICFFSLPFSHFALFPSNP